MSQSQINIKIDAERKEKWQETVEESVEYQNLTHLIGVSVSNELNGNHDDQQRQVGDSGMVSGVTNEEVLDVVEVLRKQIDELEHQVKQLQSESEELPISMVSGLLRELPKGEQNAVLPSDVADGLQFATEETARSALAELETVLDTVESTTREGIVGYYQTDE